MKRRSVQRSPSTTKRRSRLYTSATFERVHLERVFGLNVQNNAAVACDSNSGTVAYPAGCVVVLYNSKRHRQTFISNSANKCITSVNFSKDGKYIVTGESGHQPMVRVWDSEERVQVKEFDGHNFGVRCVSFSPSGRYLVSIGSQHDMMVNVWDWRHDLKISSSKVSSKVNAMAFSENGHCFLTVGNRHVRFWYMDNSRAKVKETIPLQGRNAILSDLKNNNFTDVQCGKGQNAGKTFVITQAGHLCQFNEKRVLVKWVELKTSSANCLSVSDTRIFVGCAAGVVRLFDASSLNYITTLPRPHALGVDVAASPDIPHSCGGYESEFADVNALTFDSVLQRVTVVYNDHSLYIWDVRDERKIGKIASHLYHSGTVWGIETYFNPASPAGLLKSSALSEQPVLPRDSFITCSADNTIRFWCLDSHHHVTTGLGDGRTPHSNIYSPNLTKILYTDPELMNLCDKEYNPAGTTDKTDVGYELKQGVRVVKVSPDGQHLASGDREGNVRIYSLDGFEEIRMIEAHDGEILSLDYFQSHSEPDLVLLSSTSRDRLIHVFDPAQDYFVVQTLDDHSSAVFSARLMESNSGDIRMISCGSDKSILIRVLEPNQNATSAEFFLENHIVGHHSQYDMAVDPQQRYFATACQDRQVRIYNIQTGKQRKAYSGTMSEDGSLLKCALDPSGAYLATTGSDKQLYILDFHTGEVQAHFGGHAEVVMGVRFLPDLKHLVSVSADGCIFVWRLPPDMTLHMRHRLKETATAAAGRGATQEGGKPLDFEAGHGASDSEPASVQLPEEIVALAQATPSRPTGDHSGFRFSVSVLPSWAQKKFSRRDSMVQMHNQGEASLTGGIGSEEAGDGEGDSLAPLSRRCSLESRLARYRMLKLEAPPRCVVDDKDNMEEDVEDEFSQHERRDSCCVAQRRASIQSSMTTASAAAASHSGDTESLQTGSTEDGEDDEEEEEPIISWPSVHEEEDAVPSSAYHVFAVSTEDEVGEGSHRRPTGLTLKQDQSGPDLFTPNSEEEETRDVMEEFDSVLESHEFDDPANLMTRSMEVPREDNFSDVFGSTDHLSVHSGVSGRESLSRKFLSSQSSPSFPSLVTQRARKAANSCLPKSATQPKSRPALPNMTSKARSEDALKKKDSLARAAEATNRRLQKMATRASTTAAQSSRRRSSTTSNTSASRRATAAEEARKAAEERKKAASRPLKRDPMSARSVPSGTSPTVARAAAANAAVAKSARSVSSERSSRGPTKARPSYEQATSASLARQGRTSRANTVSTTSSSDLRRAPSVGSVLSQAAPQPAPHAAPPANPTAPAPSRAQWDLKRKRDLRKSCPVQMNEDLRAASALVKNGGPPNGADLMTTSLELGHDLQPSAAHLVREADHMIQTKERPKEHVIDDESPSDGKEGGEEQVAAFFSSFLSSNRQSPKRSQRRTSAPAPPFGGSTTQLWGSASEEPPPLNGTHKSMSASTLTALEKPTALTEALGTTELHLSAAVRCCERASPAERAAARTDITRLYGLMSQLLTKTGMAPLVPMESGLVEPMLSYVSERVCEEVQRKLSLITGRSSNLEEDPEGEEEEEEEQQHEGANFTYERGET